MLLFVQMKKTQS